MKKLIVHIYNYQFSCDSGSHLCRLWHLEARRRQAFL